VVVLHRLPHLLEVIAALVVLYHHNHLEPGAVVFGLHHHLEAVEEDSHPLLHMELELELVVVCNKLIKE